MTVSCMCTHNRQRACRRRSPRVRHHSLSSGIEAKEQGVLPQWSCFQKCVRTNERKDIPKLFFVNLASMSKTPFQVRLIHSDTHINTCLYIQQRHLCYVCMCVKSTWRHIRKETVHTHTTYTQVPLLWEFFKPIFCRDIHVFMYKCVCIYKHIQTHTQVPLLRVFVKSINFTDDSADALLKDPTAEIRYESCTQTHTFSTYAWD
jgi:hypothetical protein